MGFVCAIAMMVAVFAVVWILLRWNPRAAYRMLEHSQHLFESDDAPRSARAVVAPQQRTGTSLARRQYISPLVKKRVAARQRWRCAVCKELLDETFEIDHIVPLFRGGTNDEINLQTLCKRDHTLKSALEQQK